jgi:cyclohexanone monooxygenase
VTATNGAATTATKTDAVIIGAGFAGLYLVHRLTELGFSARVIEAGDEVGGTWYWNRYPGARCDVESFYYSYSFSPELQEEWVWTERYPAQPEILAYLKHVSERFGLRRHITFGSRVVSAAFDDHSSTWTVRTDTGDSITARFLFLATGCLSAARTPDIAGIEHFAGLLLHTGRWPHEEVDLAGKRVGIIGTGSSGIQVIPEIAEVAAATVVFQRTANFCVPSWNRPLAEDEQRWVRENYPELRAKARVSPGGLPLDPPEQSALEVDPDERTRRYEESWMSGSAPRFLGTFTDLMRDMDANDTAVEFIRNKIREIVKDPVVAERLCPTTHPLGTKRLPQDVTYFEKFNDPRVSLVDLTVTPIRRFEPDAVVTSAGRIPLDVIVFATGFDAMTGSILNIDIRRSDGVRLAEHWAAGPRTYLGVAVSGFPNMFGIAGPGSPSVLSNVVTSIEQHVEWVADLLDHMRRHDLATIEATREAEDGWVDLNNEYVARTLYPGVASWYMGANVPGKPQVFMPFVGGVGVYRGLCDDVTRDNYRGFTFSRWSAAAEQASAAVAGASVMHRSGTEPHPAEG